MSIKNHLMLDKKWILEHRNKWCQKGSYNFKVCKPVKAETPYLIADKPWEMLAIGGGCLIYDMGIYRLWYQSWDKDYPKVSDYDGRLCYAESSDGVNWIKPSLNLVEYRGNSDNNIVFDGIMAGGLGYGGGHIFKDPASPDESKYRMVFAGEVMKKHNSNGYGMPVVSFAYSGDGLKWIWGVPEERCWLHSPFMSFGSDTHSPVFWDSDIKKYVGYFRYWKNDSVRCIARAETSDFGRWPYPEIILAPDQFDPDRISFYSNGAAKYSSEGDSVYLMFISIYDYETDSLNIQLATSRDSKNFDRSDRTIIIENDRDFDSEGIYVSPGIIVKEDECIMNYTGYACKHDVLAADLSYTGCFNTVHFKKDRFQGLNTDTSFEFNLKGFIYEGEGLEISLNALIRTNGCIRAGLLRYCGTSFEVSTDMEYIKGFSLNECIPVTGDDTNLMLYWEKGNVDDLRKGEKIGIRIFMDNCILYSVKIIQ